MRKLMMHSTMLINHPVLLIAAELLQEIDTAGELPISWQEVVRRELADPRTVALLSTDRILAIDGTILHSAEKLDFLLERKATDREILLLTAVNRMAAQQTGDPGLILRCCLTYGVLSKRCGVVDEAAAAFSEAELLAREQSDEELSRLASQHQLSFMYEIGEWQEACRTLSRSEEMPEITSRHRSMLLLAHASLCIATGRLPEAESLIGRALSLQTVGTIVTNGVGLRSYCHAQYGRLNTLRGNWTAAIEDFERAILDCSASSSVARYAAYIYHLKLALGDLPGATAAAQLAVSKAGERDIHRGFLLEASPEFSRQAFRHMCFWDLPFLEFLGTEESVRDEMNLQYDLWAIVSSGNISLLRNSYTTAEQTFAAGVSLATRVRLLVIYSEGFLSYGMHCEAEAAINQVVLLCRKCGWVLGETASLLLSGRVHSKGNRRQLAVQAFDRATTLAMECGIYLLHAEGMIFPAELSLTSHGESDDRLRSVLKFSRKFGDGEMEARALLQLGKLCLGAEAGSGEPLERARDYLQHAVLISERLSRSDLLRTAHDLMGWSWEMLGQRDAARAHYRAAIEFFLVERAATVSKGVQGILYAPSACVRPLRSLVDSAVRLALAAEDSNDVIVTGDCFRARRLIDLIEGGTQSESERLLSFDHRRFPFSAGEAILVFTLYQKVRSSEANNGIIVHVLSENGVSSSVSLDADRVLSAQRDLMSLIRSLAEAFHGDLSSLDTVANAKEQMSRALIALSTHLLPSAVMNLLESTEACVLTFVADGPLAAVPFTALFNNCRDRFLIDDYEISVASSLRLLMRIRAHRGANHEPALLAVAEPMGTTLEDSGDLGFLGTSIIPHFQKYVVLHGAGATMQRFLEMASDADCMHLMLHGADERNDLSRDLTVQFAQDGKPGGKESFSSRNLLQLIANGRSFPRCRLLTMNTCFSAEVLVESFEDVDTGGFPEAVMAMGVPVFVGASWQLYSNPGRLFFTEFYRRLRNEGCSTGAALRLAVLHMRQYRGPDGDWPEPYFDHPYTWGCLQLTGDGGRGL